MGQGEIGGIKISIHAPRVGSDLLEVLDEHMECVFQSTLPVWGATNICDYLYKPYSISIHAPRVGSDLLGPTTLLTTSYFNPRSPCGERLEKALRSMEE